MYKNIRPGKTWYDNNKKRIHAHGGSILYAEGKFWWYGENKEDITGRATGEQCPYWHHGVKLYSSTDLYNWTDEGFCVVESADENNPFHPKNIMDRPHILYHEKSGQYVLWAKTTPSGNFSICTFSICVGKSLKNMKFVKEITPTPHHAGDFDLFIHQGKAYIVYENPHFELVLRELTDDYTDVTDVYSTHFQAPHPPFVREAPAVFSYKDKLYMLTSGTTGYFPNPTELADITNLHGEWINLGNPCRGDKNKNSYNSQFSSVFQHPTKPNTYVALGDRWLVDLTEDLPDMMDVFYRTYGPKKESIDTLPFSDENTSLATYVWLPIHFDENDKPYLCWEQVWTV